MLVLNDLRDKPRATKKYKRVGRGRSGDRPGHGGKGQTQRSGVALGNFQGGQTPLERRLPKHRMFYTGDRLATVALESLDRLIDNKRLDASQEITSDILKALKVIKKVNKFKIVGKCVHKMNIMANAASQGALSAIEKANGSCKLIK